MNRLVTAIILNYNSVNDCNLCISYLKKQTYDNLKIILIDNDSSNINEKERLIQIAKKYDIELMLNDKNNGYSAGNNVGLRKAVENNSEWCLIINPDVIIDDRQYISKMITYIDQYPNSVVAASKIILPNGERQNPYSEITYFEELFWIFNKNKNYLMNDKTGYCYKVSGCCFFIKSSFLNEINFLDENVFLYCEEPILASQVFRFGYKELYVSEVKAKHNHILSEKGAIGKRMIKLLESRIYYLKRYSGYRGLALYIVIVSKKIQQLFWKIRG